MKLMGADFLLICDEKFEILKNAGILFDKKQILEIGEYDKLIKKSPQNTQYYKECVVTPALCNLHIHLEFSQNKGILNFGNFGNWLDSVIIHRETLMGGDLQETMQKEIKHLLQSGVGFVGAISSYGYDLEVLANSPLRVLYFNEVMGSKAEMVDVLCQNALTRLKASKDFASEKFLPALAIHSPYSVHSKLFSYILALAKQDHLPLSIHFLESYEEREWLEHKSGYFKDFFEKFFNVRMQPFYSVESFLDSLKGLQPYLVHCLQATKEELQKIKNLGGFLISCPKSNRLLNNTLLDLKLCEELGINPIFATDGKSSNDSLSLLDELRVALYAYKEYDVEELAKILLLGVTYYAGKSCNMKVGSLQVGYKPDFAVFRVEAREQIALSLLLQARTAEALYIAGEEIDLGSEI
ncbi:metal-dependent hydrolase [Helicobacter apodemus]|uniref:Metal-dependent hydrolase n=1 Tax=Helicobacter apodemus TaxID=135569 RepID=A0A4V6YSR4_9HELI|nr:aminofutalosine deaminase family hydrolase [Helicobacter apodemus]TLE16338.1 metal-dependent hydrolase [Helicobacter apodemus]